MAELTIEETGGGAPLTVSAGALLLLPPADAPLLRCIAGFDQGDRWRWQWRPQPPRVVRYWFDCWPQPWMGVTVAEEMAFASDWDEGEARAALCRWGLRDVPWDRELLGLNRADALRLVLARADYGGCALLLMEQPDAGLTDDTWHNLEVQLRAWLARSGAMAMVTSHRVG